MLLLGLIAKIYEEIKDQAW